MSDRDGRVYALTMATAIRPWGRLWLPLFLTAARHIPLITEPLRRFSLIRAAHWTIVRAVPDGRGGWQRLYPPQLLFESNYDVDLEEYIEKFAHALPWHMRAVWASSAGYPGVFPTAGFHDWVRRHQFKADHYWCAYPESTTRMVEDGLRITELLQDFEARVAGVDEKRFAAEYDRLLIDVQRYI